MKEYTSLEECRFQPGDEVVLAIGVFDGLHRAHRHIINECKRRAQERNGLAVIFTFQNHPSSALRPEKAPLLLTPYSLKRRLIKQMEVDALIGIPFDLHLSHISANDFVEKILHQQLHAKEIIIGFNFCFGYRRQGTAEMLRHSIPDRFEEVEIVDQQRYGGEIISSTLIRQKVLMGDMETVQQLLERPYQIAGTVMHGDGRGRTIGIPTANIDSSDQILPPNGVYGVSVHVEDLNSPPIWGVMNIGTVPTFTHETKRTSEVHLLDYNQDLYGKYLIVDVLERIRDERKFSGPVELVEQIHHDIAHFRHKTTAYALR